jgi:hypothetical protein
MGAFLDSPLTEKEVEAASGNGLIAGVSSMQGWRREMEVLTACVQPWHPRSHSWLAAGGWLPAAFPMRLRPCHGATVLLPACHVCMG